MMCTTMPAALLLAACSSSHLTVHLQLCVVDGRQCEALPGGGAAAPPSDLSQAMLLLNQQKQPLLTSKQAGSDGEGRVLLDLSKGCAVLHDLVVTGKLTGGMRLGKPLLSRLLRHPSALTDPSPGPPSHSFRFTLPEP